MAGGPISPYSAKPNTADRTFSYFGGSGNDTQGLGVEASLGANSTWKLRFMMPPALPTGTGKLVLHAMAPAITGAAKVNPKWASVASEQDLDGATLSAEGVSTVTWGAGDSNVIKETKITLDAATLTAGQVVSMDLDFETTSWTLASISTWTAFIIWE